MRAKDIVGGARLLRAALCLVLSLGLAPGVLAQAECGDIIRIVPNETLFEIAERCGTTVGDIVRYNPNIEDPNRVEVGTMLFMPDRERPFRVISRHYRYDDDAPPGSQPAAYGSVGDDGARYDGSGWSGSGSAAGASYRYGAGAADPVAGGGGSGSDAGYAVSGYAAARYAVSGYAAARYAASTYTVRDGDTMTSIADRFGTTVSALLDANPTIPNLHFLPAGMTLAVPPGVRQIVRQPVRQPAAPAPRDAFVPSAPDRVSISPVNGPPGSEVLLTATGLEPLRVVYLAAGPDAANRSVIGRAVTDARGNLATRVRIPSQADGGDRYVFVVLDEDYRVHAVSNPFDVDPTVAWPAADRVSPDPVELQPVSRARGF